VNQHPSHHLLVFSAILGTTMPAMATPEPTPSQSLTASKTTNDLGQVTSVSQLRDVQPTDWAFQALQSLVERYGCIAGYPDRTFRGNRALTRYEFAAGLNACMEVMTQLIEQSTADLVRQEDLATLRRLQEEFQAELATLRGRVDSLEARTAELEANQFSTTTKLNGDAFFVLGDVFGNEDLAGDIQTTFSGAVELNFDTSFTGRDLLRTRLKAGNLAGFTRDVTGTGVTTLDVEGDTGLSFELDQFFYRFPVGNNINAFVSTVGADIYDVFSLDATTDLEGSALSKFARKNPIIYETTSGAGVGANIQLSKSLGFDVLYMTDHEIASDSGLGEGLFNGDYTTGIQANFSAGNKLDLSLSYLNTFANDGSTSLAGDFGSANADSPFGNNDTIGHHVGLQAAFRPSSSFQIAAWGGVVFANEVDSDDNATVYTTAVQIAFPDLGGEGNVAGVVVGIPPKASDNDEQIREDEDTSLYVEGSYKYQLTDNIALTPGVMWVINPEHEDSNEDAVVGVVQGTFTF
jgi:hypothetical protein